MDKDNLINIDLTKSNNQFEIASFMDSDLMRIKCFATHEGKNLNGTIFPPKILINAYRTFIDKMVVIVPDVFNNPTGHGFDFKKQEFKNDERIQVGHIVDAYPVVVLADNDMRRVWESDELDSEELKDGELRIVTELVIYKHYFYELAERLKFLHEVGNLNFSMEAVVDAIDTDDGGKVCTDIHFTGLCIVDEPAFVRAYSIEVASQKEDEDMEFKELYEAEKAKNETLIAEKEQVVAELNSAKDELASVKEELANEKANVVAAQSEVEALKPFKEQVEMAEKKALGEQRAKTLEKFGVKEANVEELAEKTKQEFSDMLIEAANVMTIVVSEKQEDEGMGIITHKSTMKSDFDKLVEYLTDM